MTISQVLADFKLSNLVKHKSARAGVLKSIMDIHESAPLQKALDNMKDQDILALPVFKNSSEYTTKIYTGIVSVQDILTFGAFQEIFDHRLTLDRNSATAAMNKFKKETFFNTPLNAVLESRTVEEPVPFMFSASDSISKLVEVFAKDHHRALIVSAEIVINGIPAESTVSLVTQMDLLAYFYDAIQEKVALPSDFIEPVMTKSLFEVSLATKRVIAVSDYQPALAAFNIMHINNVHAVPILNEEDAIIGTISAKDLRGLTLDNFGSLIKPAKEFAKITGVRNFDVLDQNQVRVEDACSFMLKERVHHVWLTSGKVITGCVTPTDILKLFILAV